MFLGYCLSNSEPIQPRAAVASTLKGNMKKLKSKRQEKEKHKKYLFMWEKWSKSSEHCFNTFPL